MPSLCRPLPYLTVPTRRAAWLTHQGTPAPAQGAAFAPVSLTWTLFLSQVFIVCLCLGGRPHLGRESGGDRQRAVGVNRQRQDRQLLPRGSPQYFPAFADAEQRSV